MTRDPNDLTEAELAAMSPHDRAWYERISAQEARDAAEATNEIPVVFTREQAGAVERMLSGEIEEEKRIRNITGDPYKWTDEDLVSLEEARDLITEAMRAKGMR